MVSFPIAWCSRRVFILCTFWMSVLLYMFFFRAFLLPSISVYQSWSDQSMTTAVLFCPHNVIDPPPNATTYLPNVSYLSPLRETHLPLLPFDFAPPQFIIPRFSPQHLHTPTTGPSHSLQRSSSLPSDSTD